MVLRNHECESMMREDDRGTCRQTRTCQLPVASEFRDRNMTKENVGRVTRREELARRLGQ